MIELKLTQPSFKRFQRCIQTCICTCDLTSSKFKYKYCRCITRLLTYTKPKTNKKVCKRLAVFSNTIKSMALLSQNRLKIPPTKDTSSQTHGLDHFNKASIPSECFVIFSLRKSVTILFDFISTNKVYIVCFSYK